MRLISRPPGHFQRFPVSGPLVFHHADHLPHADIRQNSLRMPQHIKAPQHASPGVAQQNHPLSLILPPEVSDNTVQVCQHLLHTLRSVPPPIPAERFARAPLVPVYMGEHFTPGAIQLVGKQRLHAAGAAVQVQQHRRAGRFWVMEQIVLNSVGKDVFLFKRTAFLHRLLSHSLR